MLDEQLEVDDFTVIKNDEIMKKRSHEEAVVPVKGPFLSPRKPWF